MIAIPGLSTLIGLALVAPPAPVACSCECAVDPVKAAEDGAVVFQGRVERVVFLDSLRDDMSEPRIVVTLEVLRNWSGADDGSYVLHTLYNRISCEGYRFEEGEVYVLVAHPNDPARMPGSRAGWPPPNTMATLYCAVYPVDEASRIIEALDSRLGPSGVKGVP